jgi:PPOX class probable F420-dependent enzyme
MSGERGLDLGVFAYLSRGVALDRAQAAQVSERNDRSGFASEVDHLVRFSVVCRLRAHEVYRTASSARVPAFKLEHRRGVRGRWVPDILHVQGTNERLKMEADKRRQFVRDHRTCVFGYGRREHGPAMTVVYYVMDGDDILVSTMAARGKAKAVDRDSHVSLCVLDEQWPPTYLQVYGTAVVERDPEKSADLLRQVVELMAGEPVPDERRAQIAEMAQEEERVVIRVRPYATFATPPRHVNHMEDLDTLTHWTSSSLPW